MRFSKTAFLAACLLSTLIGSAQTAAFKLNGHELELPAPIRFEKGTATLKSASASALQHIADYLNEKSYISILRIEGHASDQALSEQRAMTVCNWLVKHGVDCKRLVAVGFGDTKPVVEGAYTEESGNTRIVAVNAALRGRPIGGAPLDGGGAAAGDSCE